MIAFSNFKEISFTISKNSAATKLKQLKNQNFMTEMKKKTVFFYCLSQSFNFSNFSLIN